MDMQPLHPEVERIFDEMREQMWPTSVTRELTGNKCSDPDCNCGGEGLEVALIPIDTMVN